ncbi:hypothetical protein UR09_01780 [Candidatus Nitromaritima sp. SCGC AAA799-A02]|nr:hypothetical protein UR09_01780 [Candidatus Nitromaritima sp. SCGC AAA799-A02]
MKNSGKGSRILAGLAAWLIFIQGIAFAEGGTNPDKIRDIRKLLEVSGITDQMDYMKDGVTDPFSRMISISYPRVPDKFWKEFNTLVGPEEMEVLMDRVTRIYDKHMSHEVVKHLIEMFSTPFWEEWKKKMPRISREAGLEGSRWAQELLQSETFKQKVDDLIEKYDLEKLNSNQEKSP